MTRLHCSYCDCERCHPSEGALQFLIRNKGKKELSPEEIYSRRKDQEHRVALELRQWSGSKPQRHLLSTPEQNTRQGSSAALLVSSEALTVVGNILRRFKELGSFFTHLEFQILFFWHTFQAITRQAMDTALPMMITGVLTTYTTDLELRSRAAEMLRGERDSISPDRASALSEMARLLASTGAVTRLQTSLAQGTMFYFKASNVALAKIVPFTESISHLLSRENSSATSPEMTQSLVVREECSSPSDDAVKLIPGKTPSELLREENSLLSERISQLEDEQARMREEWEITRQRLFESESENARLRNTLEEVLAIFEAPWKALEDKSGNEVAPTISMGSASVNPPQNSI